MAIRTDAVTAFIEKRQKKVGTVESTLAKSLRDRFGDPVEAYVLLLHGNKIATWYGDKVYATLAVWPTVTTRKYLNDLCLKLYSKVKGDVSLFGKSDLCPSMRLVKRCWFYQEKYEQYFGRTVSTVRKATKSEMQCQGVGYMLEQIRNSTTELDHNEWMRVL